MKIIEGDKRFVLLNEQEQEAGEVTFSVAGDTMFIIDHTLVEDEYRGKGYAEQLVAQVVEKARKEGRKIIPLCPFAKKEFDRKPEYKDVLN